jgi:hypothetical protein
MATEIFDCDQNSDAWLSARCGLATASCFGQILAKGQGKTRASYMRRLAAEIITGEPLESFTSPAMERGHLLEDEARNLYAFMHDVEPKQVGFIRNGRKGCSPDSLIGDNAVLEIKTQRGDLLIETILKDEFPSCHVAQVQGQLWVAEREFCDLIVYAPGLPPFVKRAARDERFITELASAVALFNEELDDLVHKIRTYGGAQKAEG